MDFEEIDLPTSFRVIGVGTGIVDIINKVKGLRLECVSAEIVESADDVTPGYEDKLAIIIFTDAGDTANRIANTFHDAGVLTIGFSKDAAPSCYDSIMLCESAYEYPDIVKTLLHPIVSPGQITYDFNDLNTVLRDSGYFTIKSTSGNNVQEAAEQLQALFNDLDLNHVDYISIHLFYNPNRATPLAMSEIASLQQLLSKLPETVNIIWSINYDGNLNGDEIQLSAVLAGKEGLQC